MSNIIFIDYGIDVVEKDNEFYIQYDDGGLVSIPIESRIIKEEAYKAQSSPEDALEAIIASQKEMELIFLKYNK